jgi:putative ABC transport system permease protein
VKHFPNVSAIDVTLVMQTIDAVLNKISFVIRFMALFTAGTGLLVLAGAIVTGRYQRIEESVLLRTLGATRSQILRILLAEYLVLGLLASATGAALAAAASWGLAVFVFKIGFAFYWWPVLLAVICVPALTILLGMSASRGIYNHPPLHILRAEA